MFVFKYKWLKMFVSLMYKCLQASAACHYTKLLAVQKHGQRANIPVLGKTASGFQVFLLVVPSLSWRNDRL
jgi:hypothetical protein